MTKLPLTHLRASLCGIALLLLPTRGLVAQQGASQGANTLGLIGQLATAFSRGQVIHQVQMSGNATWHLGSVEDNGTITLTSSSDGSSEMELILAASGKRTETQSGKGTNAICQWAGADGVVHNSTLTNCWKPALWFLPAFSLQPTLLPSELQAADLGTGAVGAQTGTYRHLKSQISPNQTASPFSSEITQQSATDLGLDPTTLLPAVLTYSLQPDNGASIPIAVEVRYGDYHLIDGVEIPFQIDRYVNGSLQLEIIISTATIS